jgi:hypothetical protein
MLARFLLPWYGGSAGVWTTSLLVFQVLVLAGYLYAHILSTRVAARHTQVRVHLALLAASLWFLPVLPGTPGDAAIAHPAASVALLVLATVGLPYLIVSSTTPLLQHWGHGGGAVARYPLFAVSNLGALGGLICYPLVIEPVLGLRAQAWLWSALYVLYGAGVAAFAVLSWRCRGALPTGGRAPSRPDPSRSSAGRLHDVALGRPAPRPVHAERTFHGDVAVGDGRLSLARELHLAGSRAYDLLILAGRRHFCHFVDEFNSSVAGADVQTARSWHWSRGRCSR